MQESLDQLVTVKEAAARLACSEIALRKWLSEGTLPFVKVGRLTRIRQSDIEAWMRLGLQPVQDQKEVR